MDEKMDESLEDEYVAQQEIEPQEQSAELDWEEEKRQELEKSVSVLLVDISETLRFLSEQVTRLDEATKNLPKMIDTLTATTATVQCIASELPTMVREQCLEEYKKIFDNAVKNYKQMQKAADKWQKSVEQEHDGRFRLITISAIVTPVLLFLNMIFK
ncbi:hypothetical protein AB840_08805 [Megasphaera cerevisiae DSM 20462]|uniref:Uncharacterized protein n=1 Tax=Megasphaera cerevisiae DSM 20462 TaxID=1122219 RepID=A0A0J6WUT7_9FIRM|nr:hypothetical protein [Megasphaera cerevisiae]KMO86314.1 hypothetical protein AB840_08805 [Megasphaera cerevisiae DSM 20462]OKY52931.1 hypothetical protein BSR42_10225 [Megasphaera cerevisiae]SKA00838.1 hypothetical protein SAMN05660900_02097 [Megasphaera cerevisiae DSM 20462]